jgi:transcriptional regulator of acetoin/glycerol metabolism
VDPPPKPELSFDVGVLTKALFEKARRESSLEIIPAVQRELIVNALEATAGNYAQAAELLGITRSTLRKRVGKFEIKQEFTVR